MEPEKSEGRDGWSQEEERKGWSPGKRKGGRDGAGRREGWRREKGERDGGGRNGAGRKGERDEGSDGAGKKERDVGRDGARIREKERMEAGERREGGWSQEEGEEKDGAGGGRDGAGEEKGWWHRPPPAVTPSRGRATTAPGHRPGVPGAADGPGMVLLEMLLFPSLGRVSTAIPAGMGAGGHIPCAGDHTQRRKCKSRRDFCHFQRISETFIQRDGAQIAEVGHKHGLVGKL